jgi:hypothetical protein
MTEKNHRNKKSGRATSCPVNAETEKYKEQKFNWSINTQYLCSEGKLCKDCKKYPSRSDGICFALRKIGSENLFAVFEKLNDYRDWTWRKIEQHNNGTSCGVMSMRLLDTKKMVAEHFCSLHIDDENLYKMEIKGRHRIWGIRRSDCLYLIWSDEYHYFYKHGDANYTPPKQ